MLGAIMLGGMDPVYMQRLSICLRLKFNNDIQIGTVSDIEEAKNTKWKQNIVWVGPGDFIDKLRFSANENQLVLMSEENDCPDGIYMYQSAEAIFRKLCIFTGKAGISPKNPNGTKSIVFTTSMDTNTLTLFSLLFALDISENKRVLYINLSECCGVEQILGISGENDLSDLLLDVKCGEEISRIDAFTQNIDGLDVLRPFKNPLILHEIVPDDISEFLKLIHENGNYDVVVYAAANSFNGFSHLLQSTGDIIYLKPLETNACDKSWQDYLQTQVNKSDVIKKLATKSVRINGTGIEAVRLLENEEAGRIVRRCIEEWKTRNLIHGR